MEHIDDYVPEAPICIHCQTELDLTTAHYGRVIAGWQSRQKTEVTHTVTDGPVVHQIPVTHTQYFPRKITGWVCEPCYCVLHNETYKDATGHLRRAFETVLLPVVQPDSDDHEAAKITKGLYAPHAGGKGLAAAIVEYHRHYCHTCKYAWSSPRVTAASCPNCQSDARIQYCGITDKIPTVDRKLQGFNREHRDDLKLKGKRVVVKGGKWKEDPEKYNYTPSKRK